MRVGFILIGLFASILLFSQQEGVAEISPKYKSLYIKGNALFLPLGIINTGAEYSLNEKYTLQGDVFVSPWKSFFGKHAQVYMAGIEGRYYFDEAFKRFYVGANVSYAWYNMQKWNYWKGGEIVSKYDETIRYDIKNYYQKGMSFLVGATVGYQFQWRENWNVDLYLSVGSSQGFYRGYDSVSGDRIDELNSHTHIKRKWNRSGEIVPYRGGIMISYKIK